MMGVTLTLSLSLSSHAYAFIQKWRLCHFYLRVAGGPVKSVNQEDPRGIALGGARLAMRDQLSLLAKLVCIQHLGLHLQRLQSAACKSQSTPSNVMPVRLPLRFIATLKGICSMKPWCVGSCTRCLTRGGLSAHVCTLPSLAIFLNLCYDNLNAI